jgi:DNA-directed RNA polymerase specialized sigma24 family protein
MIELISDAELIRRAARRALHDDTPGLALADLTQIGWLALLEAERSGRLPEEPRHRVCYLWRRVRGAMLDALQAERRRCPPLRETVEPDDLAGCGNPVESAVQTAQAMRALEAQASPKVRLAVAMVRQGFQHGEVARACGVSNAAITHRLRTAAKIVAPAL